MAAIEEARDIDNMSLNGKMDSLQTHKMNLFQAKREKERTLQGEQSCRGNKCTNTEDAVILVAQRLKNVLKKDKKGTQSKVANKSRNYGDDHSN